MIPQRGQWASAKEGATKAHGMPSEAKVWCSLERQRRCKAGKRLYTGAAHRGILGEGGALLGCLREFLMPSPLPACLLPLWLAPNIGSWSLLLAQQPLTAENQSGLCLRGTVPTGKPSQPLEALRADTFPAPSSYSADFHPAALLFQAEVAWLPPWEPSQGSPGQKAACLPARVLGV